jgi:predicted DNA-binding transcriptional regulator AlpA
MLREAFLGVDMENAILDLADLAALLGRSPQTIKKDLRRNRLAVPPRLHIPGTRLLRWRQVDVDAWLASHVESRVDAPGDK